MDLLDDHILVEILFWLDDEDLVNVSTVSKMFNRLYRADELWKLKIERLFNYQLNVDNPKKLYFDIPNWNKDIEGANLAAEKGNLDVLKYLAHTSLQDIILPSLLGVNSAAGNGQLKVLKWLAAELPPYHPKVLLHLPIFPDQEGIHKTVLNEHLIILEWLSQLDPPHLPDRDSIYLVSLNKNLDTLKWLVQHGIYPNKVGMAGIALAGKLEMLQYIVNLDKSCLEEGSNYEQLFPDQDCIDGAVYHDQLEVTEWLIERGLSPSQGAVDTAAKYGKLRMLKYLYGLRKEKDIIIPSQNGANLAAGAGQLEVLEWLSKKNIFPDLDGANLVATNGRLKTLEWLIDKNILPDQNSVNEATERGHLDVLIMLSQLSPSIRPDHTAIMNAATNLHFDVVAWYHGLT